MLLKIEVISPAEASNFPKVLLLGMFAQLILFDWVILGERQLKVEEPTFVKVEINLGIPIPLPLTTVKLLVSTLKTGFVDRTLNLYVPGANPLGNTPFIAGT